MVNVTYTVVSGWEKDGYMCRVTSVREGNVEDGISPISTFFFEGQNPFPCFSMRGTFCKMSEWLNENGWNRIPGTVIKKREEHIDEFGKTVNITIETKRVTK